MDVSLAIFGLVGDQAVQFYGELKFVIQHIAVLGYVTPSDPRLTTCLRQVVRPFDIAEVPVLQSRVNAVSVGAECDSYLGAPTESRSAR